MSERIKLVKNDNRPIIDLTLTNEATGAAIDLSAPTTTVVVKFRKEGSSTVLSTINCSKTNTGVDGKVNFKFTGSVLNVAPGNYEGEISISFNGEIQTVYDVLKFRVRDEF
jgi:hypothetical protein